MMPGHFESRVQDFSLDDWSMSGLVLIKVKSAWIGQSNVRGDKELDIAGLK